jgi:hypothetical protein
MHIFPPNMSMSARLLLWQLLVLTAGAFFAGGGMLAGQQEALDPAAGVPSAVIAEALETEIDGEAGRGVSVADAPLSRVRRESELPQPVRAAHFSAIRTQSPFLRTLNLTETYFLRGVAEIGGDPVATLFNRQTKKTVIVTRDRVNEEGMQMLEVVAAHDLSGGAVKVSYAGEVVELKYDIDVVSPQAKGGGSDGGHGRSDGDGKRRGPSKEDMARYNSLSEEKKQKFRDYARQTMQKYPNMSREERFNMIRGAMTRLTDGGDVELDAKSTSGSGNSAQRPAGGGGR